MNDPLGWQRLNDHVFYAYQFQMACLEEQPWFHGLITREETDKLLQHHGDYLVRETIVRATGEIKYVLSVVDYNQIKHYIIKGDQVCIHIHNKVECSGIYKHAHQLIGLQ